MAQQLTEGTPRNGRIIPVRNLKRKSAANASYLAVYMEDADGSNERCFLFTESQLKVASRRASKNPEDIPKKGWLTDLFD